MHVISQVRSGSFQVTGRQRTLVRAFCLGVIVSQAIGGFGFFRQAGWILDQWPLPDVRMTYIFLSSIAAAIGAPCAWIVWKDELRALRPIGFELMLGLPPLGGYFLWLAKDRGDRTFVVIGLLALLFAVVFAGLYGWSGRVPLNDMRPLPGIFRIAMVILCGLLVVIGSALTARVENIFPWKIPAETSTVIGLIFLSAALLFGWIAVHPFWAFGEMALTSFFAYALVLIGPYVDLWRNRNDMATVSSYYGDPGYASAVSDNGINEKSLVVYLSVLAFGIVLALAIFAWGLVQRRTSARSAVPA